MGYTVVGKVTYFLSFLLSCKHTYKVGQPQSFITTEERCMAMTQSRVNIEFIIYIFEGT